MHSLYLFLKSILNFKVKQIVSILIIIVAPLNLEAAITVGNQTFDNPTPNATTRTITSHTQNSGANGYMVVCVVSTSNFGVTISGVTWNGVSMTQLQQGTISNASGRVAFFELENPTIGNEDLVVTWSASQAYSVSISIFSFTGAQSGGNSEINQDAGSSTSAESFTISDQSIVLGMGYSNFNTSSIELPQGTARTLEFSHSAYLGIVKIALSPALSSGTGTYEANTAGGNASISLIEIQEAASVAPRRIIMGN